MLPLLGAGSVDALDTLNSISQNLNAGGIASLPVGANGKLLSSAMQASGNPVNTVIFGDSITAWNSMNSNTSFISRSNRGYFSWGNALLKYRLKLVNNAGVSGNTTTQMLARIQSDVLAYQPDLCFVMGGINDINPTVGNTPLATIKSNLDTIYQTLTNNGITVAAMTVLPVNTGWSGYANHGTINALNDWIRQYVRSHPGMVLVDTYTYVVNPTNTSGDAIANALNADNIHPEAYGAYLAGKAIYDALNTYLPPAPAPSTTSYFDSYGVNTLANQFIDNPLFTGSGGTATPGTGTVTGTIAASMQVQVAAGTAACTCSVNAVSGGYGNSQDVAIVTTTGSNVVYVKNAASIHSRLAAGDIVYAECDVDISGCTNALRVNLFTDFNNGTQSHALYQDTAAAANFPQASWTGRLRTPNYVLPSNPTSFNVIAAFGISGAGGMTAKVSNMCLRKVIA